MGIQRGLASRQAREPRDKLCVSIVFDQLDFISVIGYFIDYLGIHFGWLNHRHSGITFQILSCTYFGIFLFRLLLFLFC
jgi:hypothetical protein